MISIIRIALVACLSGGPAAVLWLVFSRFGSHFGLANAPDFPAWGVGLAVAFLAGVGEACRIFIDRRHARLNQALAEQLGGKFDELVADEELRGWRSVSLFRNDSLSGSQRVTGMHRGRQIDTFNLRYTVTSPGTGEGSGSSTNAYSQTVFRFPDAAHGFPRFLLKPRRRLMGPLSFLVGETEVELSAPDQMDAERSMAFDHFRKAYQLTVGGGTTSTADLQSLFHYYVVGWLSLHPGWSIQPDGIDLFAWRSERTFAGPARLAMLEELAELLSLLKARDVSAKWMEPVRIALRAQFRAGNIAALLGLWLGIMFGLTAGGMLGSWVLALFFANLFENAPRSPVVIITFFASTIVFAALGGYFGRRWGQRSPWLFQLTSRMDPLGSNDVTNSR